MDTSNLGCLVLAMTRLQNLRTASGLKQASLSLLIFRTLIFGKYSTSKVSHRETAGPEKGLAAPA